MGGPGGECMPKRKLALGWWLSRQMSVDAECISEQLVIGHRTAVSKAAGHIERGTDPELKRLRKMTGRNTKILGLTPYPNRTDPLSPFDKPICPGSIHCRRSPRATARAFF